MKKIALGYKGKHFILADEDRVDEFGWIDEYVDVDKVISDDKILYNYVADCRYYGIPSYLGVDKELKKRIEKIDKEIDKQEEQPVL